MSATSAPEIPIQFGPNQRRWADLKLWRLCLGLVLAPTVPYVMMAVLGHWLSGGFLLSAGDALGVIVLLCLAAVTWSLISGLGYQLAVVRLRGRTGRIECFMLGIGAACSLPAAIVLFYAVFPDLTIMGLNPGNPNPLLEALQEALLYGLGLSPFGLFGGWIFWRVGIRPAPRPLPDVAPVFD